MLTNAGSGYSRWNELSVTRWREDRTLDDWGSYIYLRDAQASRTWSAAYQPTRVEPDAYAAELLRGPRRVRPPRPHHRHHDRSPRLGRKRRRGPPRVAGQHGRHAARHRGHLLCRDRARLRRRRPGPPGVLEALRPDRIRAPVRRAPGASPEARARRPGPLGGPFRGGRRQSAGRRCQFETDRAQFIGVGRDLSAPEALERPLSEHGGNRARSGLQPPAHRCGSRPEGRRGSRSGRWSDRAGKRCSNGSSTTTTRSPSSAPGRSPGPTPRSSSATWT